MRQPPARRSELATPASRERMCEKAAGSGADLVFLDLEDACAPVVKEAARGIAVAALTNLDWGRTVRAVRVNGIDTPWCHGDIIELVTGARDALDVLIVPKARTARDVWWVDVLLTQLETRLGLSRPIALEVLIEEAEGLANAAEIARASARIEAVIFGAGDLSASLHARVDGISTPSVSTPATSGTSRGSRCSPRHEQPGSTRSTRHIRRTATPTATVEPRCTRASSASTGNGRSIRTRSRSPTRCSPRPRRRSTTRRRRWRTIAPPRRAVSVRSGATEGSSTPPTCGSRRTCSTRCR